MADPQAAPQVTIADVRQKFPQYDDVSDLDLAKGLHAKYYSDMDFDQFADKIGLKTPGIGTQLGHAAEDVVGGVAHGLGTAYDVAHNVVRTIKGEPAEDLDTSDHPNKNSMAATMAGPFQHAPDYEPEDLKQKVGAEARKNSPVAGAVDTAMGSNLGRAVTDVVKPAADIAGAVGTIAGVPRRTPRSRRRGGYGSECDHPPERRGRGHCGLQPAHRAGAPSWIQAHGSGRTARDEYREQRSAGRHARGAHRRHFHGYYPP